MLAALMLLSCTVSAVSADIWYDVRVEGNSALSSREILETTGVDVASGISLEELTGALPGVANRYGSLGYWQAELSTSIDSDEDCLVITVDEGSLVLLSEVLVEGNRVFNELELRQVLTLRPGMVLTRNGLEQDIAALLEFYEQQGYPFAVVIPEKFSLNDGLQFTLRVEEGEEVRLAGIHVTGNTTTKSSFIARQMDIRGGQKYTRDHMETARAALWRTGLFDQIGEFGVGRVPNSDEFQLIVPVVEKQVNRFSGILGYGSDPKTVSGMLDLALGNVGGKGRKVGLHWFRRNRSRSQFRASYTHPWIVGFPVELIARFRHEVDDPNYLLTAASLGVGSGLREGMKRALLVGFERTVYGHDGLVRRDKTSLVLEIGYGKPSLYRSDSLRRANVHGAAQYSSVEEVSTSGTRNGSNVRLSIDGSVAPLARERWICVLDFSGGKSYDSQGLIRPDDLFRIGGTQTLRGFREEQFRVESYAIVRAELHRLFIGNAGSLYPFVDCAAYTGSKYLGDTAGWRTKCGYGVGLGMPSRMGVVTVGIGCAGSWILDNAKLHLAVEKAF
jgi:outer membrane protein insertion porin family